MMKKYPLTISIIMALTLAQGMAAENSVDKADTGFMLICTALVLFMTLPGIALFYGGLLRSKNILSLGTQIMVTFALSCVLWVIYGYSLAFSGEGLFFGNLNFLMLNGIDLTDIEGSIYKLVHVAFQCSFACISIALILGSFAERIRFSAVLIFVSIWFTLAYVPMAHMVWGGGFIAKMGAIDFAGGTVVHINAAVAGFVVAWLVGKRVGCGHEHFKPHNLPMVLMGTAILYIGWFGFNAGSAGAANEIAALAFINTMVATAGAILSWVIIEWFVRQKPSLLGACSGCIAGLVTITPAAGSVGVGGALVIGLIGGVAGFWGVVTLKKWLKFTDDACDVFGLHGVCGMVGCLATGVFTASRLGGIGYAEGVSMTLQVWTQFISIIICLVWSGLVALIAAKTADILVGLRVTEEHEREGLDITSHGENAYNH